MKISYKWLQSYFDDTLPEPNELADVFTFSFAEVEEVIAVEGDTVFDLKVLPDRACYALSHRGVAYDLAAKIGKAKKEMSWPKPEIAPIQPVEVSVESKDLCLRYMARRVEGISQKEAPWAKEHLESIGQRSINPIVDGANIVMFDMGQPLHAFDADKVVGGITVRRAKEGEKITTLDNKEVSLDSSVLVIADDEGPLALAGIKGGKKAEVTADTKNIIIESASFDATYVRRASERLGVRTDSSKRYENKLSPELTSVGLDDFSAYLFEMDKGIKAGAAFDWYPEKPEVKKFEVSKNFIEQKLGMEISETDIENILSRLGVAFEKTGTSWMVMPPVFRADLAIPEDIVEEIGRIKGFDKLQAILPPKAEVSEIPKAFYYEWKIREILINSGFSEVMTSSFGSSGEIAIEKPLASDKKYARKDLRTNFAKALEMNALNAPLLGESETRIFEIGRIFTKEGERTALAIGFSGPKKKVSGELTDALEQLAQAGIALIGEMKDGVWEGNIDEVLSKLAEPKSWDIEISHGGGTFKSFSLFPFIVRDVALFVSPETTEEEVRQVIIASPGDTNLVVKGPDCFDRFEKEGRKSLAFRTVFQSFERTLSDDEVNGIMEKVYSALKAKGWEVR